MYLTFLFILIILDIAVIIDMCIRNNMQKSDIILSFVLGLTLGLAIMSSWISLPNF